MRNCKNCAHNCEDRSLFDYYVILTSNKGYFQMVTYPVINICLLSQLEPLLFKTLLWHDTCRYHYVKWQMKRYCYDHSSLDIIILQDFDSHVIIFEFVVLDSRPLQNKEEIISSLKSKNLMRISNIMHTCGRQPPEYFVTRLFNLDNIPFFWV